MNRKIRKVVLAFIMIFTCGFAVARSLDKVVAVIGNEAIFQSDVEMYYKELKVAGQLPEGDAKCELLKMFMDQKLLVAQAKLDSLQVDVGNIANSVDRKIIATQAQLGSKEALETYYQKNVDKLREEIIEFQTQQAYAQAEQSNIVAGIKVTPGEVEKFFKTIPKDSLPTIPDQYMIFQIVKKPDSDAAKLETKEQLLDLRKRILKGEKFQTLAMLYSEDPGTAKRGGELGLTPIEGYVPPVRNALNNMRPGQISHIVESEYGYHILQMIEKQDGTGLVNYRHILLKPKYTSDDQVRGFKKLDSIVSQIKADSITFENAALRFSDDENSKLGKGLVVNTDYQTGDITPYFYKDQLNSNDFKAIEHAGIGEISEPFESVDHSGNVVYKVVMIKAFIPSHKANMKDDYLQINRLYENKLQFEKIQQWTEKKRKTEYIRVNKDYASCPFVDPSWLY